MFESGNHSAPVYRYVYSHDSIITSVDPYRINVLSHGLKLALNYFLDYEIFELGLGVAHADELVMVRKNRNASSRALSCCFKACPPCARSYLHPTACPCTPASQRTTAWWASGSSSS